MEEILLNIEEIKSLIPHRSPMLLLDQARLQPPSKVFSTYYVKGNEFFLQGHYPGNPLVPGNIQCEMLAQLGTILVAYNSREESHPYYRLRKGRTPVLAALNNVRFRTPVYPGDTIELSLTIIKDSGLVASVNAFTAVRNTVSVSLEMTVAYI